MSSRAPARLMVASVDSGLISETVPISVVLPTPIGPTTRIFAAPATLGCTYMTGASSMSSVLSVPFMPWVSFMSPSTPSVPFAPSVRPVSSARPVSGIEISELAFKPIEHLPQQVHIGALGHPDGRARHDVPPVDEIGEQHLHDGRWLAEVSRDLRHRQQPLTAADDPPVLGLES